MVCLITSVDFFIYPTLYEASFSGQQELSELDYYFQDGGKTGAQTNQSFWKLKNIFWWSKVTHIIIKGWNFMIKSFSGQVAFCFAILGAISAYVGENWLSQYTARPSFEYYRQVYFVHSGLQDESLHVTISKLPYSFLTCTGGDFPAQGTSG